MKRQKEIERGSLLRQMPQQERNEERQGHHHEKRQTGHPGRVPELWDEDVPHRQEVSSLGTRDRSC